MEQPATRAPLASSGAAPAEAASALSVLRRTLRGFFLITTAVMLVVHTATLAVIVPKFASIFRDFGVELPRLTRAFILLSSWVTGRNPGQRIPGAVYVAIGAACVGAALIVLSKRRTGMVLLILLDLGAILLLGLMVVAMYLPIITMMDSLQTGKP
jgi:type II secretory pathway component PulF